jgi:DNA polymerase-3 subunit delta'
VGVYRTRGHAAALGFVERAIVRDQPPHALLLLGPERVGKTTLALDLAAGLLCLDPDPLARPCGECAACRKVDHGNHPDIHRLAPEGGGQQLRVGQVQALATELALLPLEGRYRVAIVERAQRLNLDAQHALLKTLEEPPPAVVIVLAADDAAPLLPTVISRCARVRLGPVSVETIAGMLTDAGLADAARGALLGRLAGGRPGLALALSDQPDAVLSQARLARMLIDLLDASRRQRLQAAQGLLDEGALLAAAGTGAPADDRGSAARGDRRASPAERRAAAAQIMSAWRLVARDVALAARGGRRELQQRDLLDELTAAAARVEPGSMTRFLGRLEAGIRAVDGYANPELALDVLLLAWPSARAAA